MKLKLRLLYKLFLIFLLFYFGIIIAAGLFPAIACLFSPSAARIQRDRIKLLWLKTFGLLINLTIVKNGRVSEQTAMLASNHISWLDIIVIGQYKPACFVAKSDILHWPVIGFLSRQAGTIFIRRGDKKNILGTADKMISLLKQNGTIIAFPEGTTTKGDQVLNFHASLFQPALSTHSAIQPVAIQYHGASKEHAPFVGDDTFVKHLIKMLMLEKIEASLCFLPVIDTSGKDRQTVSHETRRLIVTALTNETVSTESDWRLCTSDPEMASHQVYRAVDSGTKA